MGPEYLEPVGNWDINGWRNAHILSEIARYINNAVNAKIVVKMIGSIGREPDEDEGGEGGEGEGGEAGEGREGGGEEGGGIC